MPLDVAREVAEILLDTGRATHPGAWIERLVNEHAAARAAALPANLI